ncbi:hypothetical protein [Azoarcus sp. KH32C]|uniref:hypothetical protein n=1 Tax=Azoarcus sp. KH32C TaxID=748247 RepID=UPI00059F57F3|nr:hypothetical protein [Azoarcus sp. KH32C]
MNPVNTAAAINDAEPKAHKLEMLLAPYGKLEAEQAATPLIPTDAEHLSEFNEWARPWGFMAELDDEYTHDPDSFGGPFVVRYQRYPGYGWAVVGMGMAWDDMVTMVRLSIKEEEDAEETAEHEAADDLRSIGIRASTNGM